MERNRERERKEEGRRDVPDSWAYLMLSDRSWLHDLSLLLVLLTKRQRRQVEREREKKRDRKRSRRRRRRRRRTRRPLTLIASDDLRFLLFPF